MINKWNPLGYTIVGAVSGDQFGHSVSVSADGMTTAAGAALNDDTGRSSGHARMFTYSPITNTWNQVGNAIVGVASGDQFGLSVSWSPDAAPTRVIPT